MVNWGAFLFSQLGFYLFNMCIVLAENYQRNLIQQLQESERSYEI